MTGGRWEPEPDGIPFEPITALGGVLGMVGALSVLGILVWRKIAQPRRTP